MHIFAYMQHSHPHIALYWEVIFLSWGGDILRKVEAMIMILSSLSLDYLIPPYTGVLTMLLCSSLTNTFNNNFGTNCGSAWPSIDNLRQLLAIRYCTT